MAAAAAGVRQAGFRVPEPAAGGVRGWLFLAWVSAAWLAAEGECGVLAREAGAEPGAGPAGHPHASADGLAGAADLGA